MFNKYVLVIQKQVDPEIKKCPEVSHEKQEVKEQVRQPTKIDEQDSHLQVDELKKYELF